MFPYFYPAVKPQYCPSVCPSVTFRYRDHICWNTSKIISPPNNDKIVMWRFLRNRRLLLCLHTIFRAVIYWAHRAVILAIAWHLVESGTDLISDSYAAERWLENEYTRTTSYIRPLLLYYPEWSGTRELNWKSNIIFKHAPRVLRESCSP